MDPGEACIYLCHRAQQVDSFLKMKSPVFSTLFKNVAGKTKQPD